MTFIRQPHVAEDDLTLYYYGEGPRRERIERHLEECAACAALYREISGTLAMVSAEAEAVPERGDQYGLEVWQRIRHRLPEQEGGWGWGWGLGAGGWAQRAQRTQRWFSGLSGLSVAAAAAVLLLAAFVAGRVWQHSAEPQVAQVVQAPVPGPQSPQPPAPSPQSQAPSLILLTSVADHLDRSERVLTDIMNAPEVTGTGHGDISVEQRWAEDLITTSRLYRQDAVDAGEQSVADVLDDLERNLLEIVHSPSKITAADLEQIRRRIDAAALLFKVRVMSNELRQRESAPAERTGPRTSTSSHSKVS